MMTHKHSDKVPEKPMTPLEKLKAAEKLWLEGSDEEDFYFSAFCQPKRLRRSRRFPGALSSLEFGKYEALNGEWVASERAVWLGIIVSIAPGHGGQLLDALAKGLGRHGLALIGTPTAMKPRDWDETRSWDSRPATLICWYLRHGFRVIQSGSETRVAHTPLPHMLETQFSLI